MAPSNKEYKDEEQQRNDETIVAHKESNKDWEQQAPTPASMFKAAIFLASFFVVITMILRIFAKDD